MAVTVATIDNRVYAVRIVNESYNDTQAEVEVLNPPHRGKICVVNSEDIRTHSIEVQQLDDQIFVGYPRLGIGVDISEGTEMTWGQHQSFYRIALGMEVIGIKTKKDAAIRHAKVIVERLDIAQEMAASQSGK